MSSWKSSRKATRSENEWRRWRRGYERAQRVGKKKIRRERSISQRIQRTSLFTAAMPWRWCVRTSYTHTHTHTFTHTRRWSRTKAFSFPPRSRIFFSTNAPDTPIGHPCENFTWLHDPDTLEDRKPILVDNHRQRNRYRYQRTRL